MSAFDFDSPSPARSRSRQPAGPSWLHTFTATFAAVFLAGLLLLVGIRFYVYWSIQDTLEKWKNPPAKVAK
jgi:hypothetical protein